MHSTVTINLAKPIRSVKILDNYGGDGESSRQSGVTGAVNPGQDKLTEDLGIQKSALSQICQILQKLVDELNQLHEKIFAEHREEISKLSVEIARKILMQKVRDGDYEIESIVKEALKNTPTRQDLVVHLNPEDLAQCQKLQQTDASGTLAGIKFVADSNIGRAECLLETPKGVIESAINEKLEIIGKALTKAQ